MKDARKLVLGFMAVVLACASVGNAQEGNYRQVDNPYQGELAYRLGAKATPMVVIDGLRWKTISVSEVGSKPLQSGRAIKTEVGAEFENTEDGSATVVVVILFEDEQGNSLDRIECKRERIGGGSTRKIRQRFKIQADVLREMARLYLFAEVRR